MDDAVFHLFILFFHSLEQGQLSFAPYSLPFGSVLFPAVQHISTFKCNKEHRETISILNSLKLLLHALKGGVYRAAASLPLCITPGIPSSLFYHLPYIPCEGRKQAFIYSLDPSLCPFCMSLPHTLLTEPVPQKQSRTVTGIALHALF